jgi:hypothetical protein
MPTGSEIVRLSGAIMKAIQQSFPAQEWDRNYAQRLKETMY